MGSVSIRDVLKNSFLDNFVNNIPIMDIILTLGVAFIFSIITFFVYKLMSKNIIYSKKFNVTMSLMSIITSAIIMSMQSNIVVSLGMVGALSIVRFRTAIKEPRDLLFLFWSISNGIIIGAGAYGLAVALLVFLVIALIIFDRIPTSKMPYLLVVNATDKFLETELEEILDNNKAKYFVKSRNISSSRRDIVYEVSIKDEIETISQISKLEGVNAVNLLHQDGECQF